jgi:hypothetical protein
MGTKFRITEPNPTEVYVYNILYIKTCEKKGKDEKGIKGEIIIIKGHFVELQQGKN